MDIHIDNDAEIPRNIGTRALDDYERFLLPQARVSTFSVFESDRTTPMSQAASLLLLPSTFGSIAIQAFSIWSDPYPGEVPDNLIPLPGEDWSLNLSRPSWRDEIERRVVYVTEEDIPGTSSTPGGKRRRIDMTPVIVGASGAAGPQPMQMQQARRKRFYYDHQVSNNLARSDVIASFSAFQVSVIEARI